MPQLFDPVQPWKTVGDPEQPVQPFQSKIPFTQGQQHDTFEITEIYLQRPISLRDLKLSQWFCLAHGLQDWELQNAASLGDCKRQMLNKGYVFLSLEPLKKFNKESAITELKQRCGK